MSERAYLRRALVWACPGCGTEHIVQNLVEAKPQDIARAAAQGKRGLLFAPDAVWCKVCEQHYETEVEGQEHE